MTLSLTPDETDAIVNVARESKYGIGKMRDLHRAAKFFKRAAEKGSGKGRADALYELSHLDLNSPGEDFIMLSMYSLV